MICRILLGCLALMLFFFLPAAAKAQDYDIQRFDINLQLQPATNSAQIDSKLALINITKQNQSGLFVNLLINKRAKVSAVQVEGATAQFRVKEDARLNELSNLTIDFPKSLPPGASTTVSINYTLEYKESTPIGAIAPGETLLMPESFWVPFVHTPFKLYGLDVAPYKLTVTVNENENVISDGLRRNGSSPFVFEQTVPAQPLLLSGNFDAPFEIKAGNTTIEFVFMRGLGDNARKQAEALAKECGAMLDYYQRVFGLAAPAQLRIVASPQVVSYVSGTTLVFNEDLFRRDQLDAETLEFTARSLLRSKIGGELAPRGRGWTIFQDAVPAYLAGLYFENRYGPEGGKEFFLRRARAYAPLAASKNDGPLLANNPLDSQYPTSIYNKGPLMLRIIEKQLGSEKMLAILKEQFNNKTRQLRFDDLRAALLAADKNLTTFFTQWFENINEPDLIIGIPIAVEGGWKCALRNLGTGVLQKVTVLAITNKGQQLTTTVDIPEKGLVDVTFKTPDQIASVEVDPDKLYPQSNFDNDARPVAASPFSLYRDANLNFTRKEYTEAEAKLREAIKHEPNNAVTRTLLARTLAAQNKFDEAKAEITNIQKLAPLPIYALTWTNYTMGEIALAQKQREAVDYFRRAVAASRDIVPARLKLIEAERSNQQLPAVDESVRGFIGQLDRALREATYPALEPMMMKVNLLKFMRGVVANKPNTWTTEILRAEQVSADRVAVDVSIVASTEDKKDQRGTALLILRRNQSGWILKNIELFNVQ